MEALGKYFTLDELTASATARRLGLSNMPLTEHVENLRQLVACTLDPLRQLWGKPLRVNSGYRSPTLNTAVGGARNSQHCRGCAADITTLSLDANRSLLGIILENYRTLSFDQIIAEKCDRHGCPRWIHISYSSTGNRKEILYR